MFPSGTLQRTDCPNLARRRPLARADPLVPPTVGRVDSHLAYLLRPGLLGDVVQDQIPELQVVIHGIEFELAILKPDSSRALLARGVESIEVGLSECH